MPYTTARQLYDHAHAAAEAVRALNHATLTGSRLDADQLDQVLDQLELTGQRFAQALHQLGQRLGTDTDGEVGGRLDQAAGSAAQLAQQIRAARAVLTDPHRDDPDGAAR